MFRIPENLKSKYEFVILAAKRAEQLQMGALPRLESDSSKVTVVAQQEVAEGLVTAYDPTQATPDAEVEEE
jgi:DNA-directed RNA polymerase subunit omega